MSENIARVALYIRATTTDRANHLEQLLCDFAAASIGGHLSEVFTDLGGSRRRPALDTAFAAAQAGRFGVLLVNSVHDLTGAPRLRQIVERFQAASVTVRSLAEQFDSTSWSAAFWMYVIDAENAAHQERSRHGIDHAARRGPRPSRSNRRDHHGSRSPVVAIPALYAAVADDNLGWLDELLIAAGAMRRCDCTATAPTAEPCPICGAQPPAAATVPTGTTKDGDR
jgi:hypothetical protein